MTTAVLTQQDFAARLQRANAVRFGHRSGESTSEAVITAGDLMSDFDATPCPGRFHGQCTVVTSLSPNPLRLQRQKLCLQSWIDIGLPVIAVQTEAELSIFGSQFSGLEFRICNDLTTEYERPTQRVSTLIGVGKQTERPFCLMNADVEIYGDSKIITDALCRLSHSEGNATFAERKATLAIGIRYNHAARQSRESATLEQWGLDFFAMTPAMAETIPPLRFGLGKPVWDYWLPHHFRDLGYQFHWIRTPFFFHEIHPLGWSQSDWSLGATWLADHYGSSLESNPSVFRRSLDLG